MCVTECDSPETSVGILQSFGYGGTGKKSNAGTFEDYGEPFGKGDVIGVCIDLEESYSISFCKNGVSLYFFL